MRRVLRYSHTGADIGELHPDEIMSLVRTEEINGEHSLMIVTLQVLSKNERILYEDGRGVWREYVVTGVDEKHASGMRAMGSYYCVWSLSVDLMGVVVSVMPGVQNPVTAGAALSSILEGQSRWTRGTVTQTATGGASMYDMSAWQALGVLVDVWGGELGATIEVSDTTGVVSRRVDLYAAQGSATAKRRFDFGRDLRSVRRTLPEDPLYCRISPRGKGEETEGGGYGRKIRITEVNDGKDYLEYAPMVDVCKLPDGNGYMYPTLIVENSDCETPAELLAWAQGVLEDYCSPKVTYEVDVLQVAEEGTDVQGVSLGDAVHVVDRYFGDGVRLSGRVVSMVVDELGDQEIKVTIGHLDGGVAGSIASAISASDYTRRAVTDLQGRMSTAVYVDELLDRLNAEINAMGGYMYMVPGHGILTYDVAVADPLDPTEASRVVEIKGGTIRIADSRTAQGEWEWRTVFVSGHIAAELVTSASITTGYIGNASGGFFLDLDNGIYRMPTTMTVGGSTVQSIADGAAGSAESAAKSYADTKDASTLSSAKSYADGKASSTLSQADINAKAIADALDASLDQQEVIDRLLGGSQGIAVDPETGDLYISGTLIKAGTIDAALIKAGILTDAAGKNYWNMVTGYLNTTYGKIGGFDIGQYAIYNGLNSLTGTAEGVYLGTNGVACSTEYSENNQTVQHSVAFSGGGIEGRYNGSVVGRFTPNATATGDDGNGNTVTNHGFALWGDVFDIRTPHLTVMDANSTSGESTHTVTVTDTTTSANKHYATRFVPRSVSNDVLKGYVRLVFPKYINGLFVGSTVNYWSSVGSGDIEIPLKAYVDSAIADLKTWVGQQGYLTSLPSHTHSWESDITNKPTIPTFSLSGRNLNITT